MRPGRGARLGGAPSTREGLEHIRAARKRGQKVLVETCPQYLTLTEEVYRLPDFGGAA